MEKKTKTGNEKRQYEKPQLLVLTLQSEKSLLQASQKATMNNPLLEETW